jgi:hypothetical protein
MKAQVDLFSLEDHCSPLEARRRRVSYGHIKISLLIYLGLLLMAINHERGNKGAKRGRQGGETGATRGRE